MIDHEAVCPQCGARYAGWALSQLCHQQCAECGSALKITCDGVSQGRDNARLDDGDLSLFFDRSGDTIRDNAIRLRVRIYFSLN
jgi:hypothetical protein